MSLAAYICHADGDRLEAAHAFLADLREGDATITVAEPDEITPLVGRALGSTAVAAQRVAVDPGGVTLLHHTPDGDLTACMVNVTPADPLRRGVAAQRRLYLIRHGEADTPDADGRLHSHVPLPLTPRGRWQAGVLREAFAPVPADRVHASDIARTEETARRLAGPPPGSASTRVCGSSRWASSRARTATTSSRRRRASWSTPTRPCPAASRSATWDAGRDRPSTGSWPATTATTWSSSRTAA